MQEDEFFEKLEAFLEKYFAPVYEYIDMYKEAIKATKEITEIEKTTTKKQKIKADRMICDIKIDHETDKAYKALRKEDGKIKWIPKKYVQNLLNFEDGWSEITLTKDGAWISKKEWEDDKYKN